MIACIFQDMAVHRVCVCVFRWWQVCVYIYTYMWVCKYMGTGAAAIASLKRLKEAQLSVLDFLL